VSQPEIEEALVQPAPHPGPRSRSPLRHVLNGALGLVLAALVAGPAGAGLVMDRAAENDAGAGRVFARMAEAWREGDARAVTDLVHPDGLTVTSGPDAERRTHYSPSQAYYYFKNLFQSHDTVAFGFDKVQGGGDSVRAHGMATWERRRPGQERNQVVKLMCVLARVDDGWMLAEIHTIR